jgi:hypothetical protein
MILDEYLGRRSGDKLFGCDKVTGMSVPLVKGTQVCVEFRHIISQALFPYNIPRKGLQYSAGCL